MKNKDTLMLAEAYSKILKENESEFVTSWKDDPLGFKDNPINDDKGSYNENDKLAEIEKELEESKPSENQINLIKNLSENDIDELINHLNEKGNMDGSLWKLKDNLIKQLYSMTK